MEILRADVDGEARPERVKRRKSAVRRTVGQGRERGVQQAVNFRVVVVEFLIQSRSGEAINRAVHISMRNSDAVRVGEIGTNFTGVGHEGMAVGVLHFEMGGEILRHGGKNQNRAPLIGFAQQ